jgi:serpin B
MQAKIFYAIVLVIAIICIASYFVITSVSQTTPSYYSAANASMVANSVNGFAFKIYSAISNGTDNSSNLFLSPFSIYTAMTMASEGARSATFNQLQSALGFSGNVSDNNAGFKSLLGDLAAHSSDYQLSIADGLWVQKNFGIEANFTNVLSSYYGATAQQADFMNNSDGERTNINNWVAGKTNNKITNLIPPGGITAFTRLVLVNAVYFKGLWAEQFKASDTSPALFFITPSRNVTVQMMHEETKNASYYANSTVQALSLDYKGSGVSMLILLPTQNSSLSQLQSSLSVSGLANIRSKMSGRTDVRVSLPKFNITTPSVDLNAPLESLGIENAFNPSAANFTGRSPNVVPSNNLYISDVFHKAYIKVDEQGTEAAAATAVVIASSGALEKPVVQVFNADHPFIFFIIDNRSGAILFMGRIANPTNSGGS